MRRGDHFTDDYIFESQQSGRFSVAMCGWMTETIAGGIVCIQGRFNTDQYLHMVPMLNIGVQANTLRNTETGMEELEGYLICFDEEKEFDRDNH